VEVSNGSAYTEIWYTQAAKIFMNGSTIKYAYWPTPAGGTLMETGNGGAYYYQHKDWLGRAPIISKLTSSGTVYGDYAFAPYGEIYDTFGTVALDQENFTGDSLDLGVATMFHTDHRELNALEGRWISPDPAGAGWNLYAYGTDPNGGIDPSGLIFGDPIILAIEWSQGDGWGDFGCSLDGVGTGCNLLSSALQGGGIAPCPQCAIGQRVGADGNIYQDGQYNAPTVYWSAPDNLWVIAIKAVGYGESVVGTTNDGSSAANNSSWGWNFTKAFFGGLVSAAGWKAVYNSTFHEGGCDNLMFSTALEVLNPLPSDDLGEGDYADAAVKGTAAGSIAAYRLGASSVGGELAATSTFLEGATTYGLPVYAGGKGVVTAGMAAYNGECF
jgi:RHS repeat-associated protein